MFDPRRLRIIEAALVGLFFIQAWRALIAAMFGILYDHGFEGPATWWTYTAVIFLLLALAAPLAAPRRFPRQTLLGAAIIVALARPFLNADSLLAHYWSALIILAAGGMYLTALIHNQPGSVAGSLIAALVADQLLRALGNTFDPGLNPAWLLPFSLLALTGLTTLAAIVFAGLPHEKLESGHLTPAGGLALGAILFIETSLLTLPNAAARWSNFEYAVIAPVFAAVTCLFLLSQVRQWARRVLTSRWSGVGLIVLALAGLSAGYARMGVLSALGLLVAHLAVLAALVQIAELNPDHKPERPGLWLMVGLWLVAFFNFAVSFTFTYAYTLPFMRGAGWVIYALAILIATQALLTCKGSDSLAKPHRPIAALVAIGLVTLIVLAAAWPPAENTKSSDGALTAVTFTIRYGYDNAWHYRLDEIATAIERVNADIVTLQEADTGRLTSYGTDTVLYLARRLRMNVVYWPTVEHLTGIAILHRLPTAGYDSQLLTSIKEQTGVLHVHLQPGGRDLDVYGTWLGIRGENTLRQVNEIVQFIGDKRPTILGGAFFAMQDSPIYTAVNDAGFDFVALGLGLPPPPDAIDPAHHVDYVWTRGLKPLRGWTPGGPAMNHAMVAVQFELP